MPPKLPLLPLLLTLVGCSAPQAPDLSCTCETGAAGTLVDRSDGARVCTCNEPNAAPDAGLAPDEAFVAAGTFTMGCGSCTRNTESQVNLSAFVVDRFEATEQQYAQCVSAGRCSVPTCGPYDPITRAKHPVSCVTWDQARAYCAFRNKRLPTEAEWEKAARSTDGRLFPWGNEKASCTYGNFSGCAGGGTAEVGQFGAGISPYGAYDLMGNVEEFVSDLYDFNYIASGTDPTGPTSGSARVVKGDSYLDSLVTGAHYRESQMPTDSNPNVGVRCVRAP